MYLRFLSIALCCLLFSACSLTGDTSPPSNTNASLLSSIQVAATGDHRSEKNILRNQYRHPVETLRFFGLNQDMSVLEITPGGLWYTEILAPVLKRSGKLTVASYDVSVPGQPEYRYRGHQSMLDRFAAEAETFGEIDIVKFSPPQSIELGADNSYDMVLTFRNTHNWIRSESADAVFQAFYKALKPGGILGLVQHRAPSAQQENPKKGYISEATIISLATAAGFQLEEKSEINANAKDSHDHPAGVWSLPPILRLGEENKNHYLSIGESDRMTLRFQKPAE